MLHDLDLFSLQGVRNNIDIACDAWRGCKCFGQAGVDSGVEAGAAAHRDRCFFDCENVVLAAMAQDGKKCIGPRTIVTPRARALAARRDVPGLAQR